MGTLKVVAQPPGVPVYPVGGNIPDAIRLTNAVEKLRLSGESVRLRDVRDQLRRTSCQLDLPKPGATRLSSREVWDRARRSHLRIGWSYQCTQCDAWHLQLAGGYLISTNGAAATSYHVVEPARNARDGCLVAVTDDGRALPVKEVLAADRYSGICILRVSGEGLVPLPLNLEAYPGDKVFCLSDPIGRQGYFSQGILNRFVQWPGRRRVRELGGPVHAPTRIEMSADWGPGSSGSAVLDEFGNAIGHVSSITIAGEEGSTDTSEVNAASPKGMIVHEAVSARDVLSLIRPAK